MDPTFAVEIYLGALMVVMVFLSIYLGVKRDKKEQEEKRQAE
jgi:NADH:ubiquinone oxidoreductase subunit 6 (subunit J)